jgi:hypothetical protein
MQTFNYLIHSFMVSRQAWLAQAIVCHLRALQESGIEEEACIDRLLLIWEVIAENLQRHAIQPTALESAMPVPFDFNSSIDSQRILYEA